MDEMTREMMLKHVKEWTLEAGDLIREKMHRPLTIDTKSSAKDLVTQLDQEVEFFFASKIKSYFPTHFLISEEGYGDTKVDKNGTIWIIDPIDGTMNFIHQKKNFAISVGIYHKGIGEIGVIYDVINNHFYSAIKDGGAYKNNTRLPALPDYKELSKSIVYLNHFWLTPNRFIDEKVMQKFIKDVRGTRSYGSAALAFADIAEGSVDAYMTMRLQPWDMAAGKVITNEVGAVLTNVRGEPINAFEGSSVLVCHPAIQKQIIDGYVSKAIK